MSAEKKRRARPFEIEPGTVINRRECPECKGTVQIKINAAQKAYFNCPHGDAEGYACGFGVRWGARASEKMRIAFHRAQGTGPRNLTGNVNAPPAANLNRPLPTLRNETKPAPAQKVETTDEYGLGL